MDGRSMSKINVIKLLVLGSIVGLTVFLAIHSRRVEPVRRGDDAPDFTLPALSGEKISLADFRGRVVVLNFWATWCPPCVEEMPSLKRFADQIEPFGVTVLGVSVDHDPDALQKFVAETKLGFPIARDADQKVSSRYGTFKFPETYIINSEGRVAEKLIGAIDWQDAQVVSRVRSLARTRDPRAR
jgi:peroxiredoxin